MYDLNKDGNISREELHRILRMMVGATVPEEQVRVYFCDFL